MNADEDSFFLMNADMRINDSRRGNDGTIEKDQQRVFSGLQ
jgi:hypothetical protein